MSEIKNVTIIKKANIYFDGQVTSRRVLFADGSTKSLGIMLPGEYVFNTGVKEIMAGDLEVLIPGEDRWMMVTGGGSFEVPAQAKFSLKIKTVTDYCCSYIG